MPLTNQSSERLRIIVTGYVVRLPLAGNVWCYLQYALGLHRLGHDVYFVEESGDSPYCCYDLENYTSGTDPSSGIRFISKAFQKFGMENRWAYWDAHTKSWKGPCRESIVSICESADLLLRMPAMVDSLQPWLEQIPVRALIDHDPVFTQVRHLKDSAAKADADNYTVYFSFGENIELGKSKVPDDGYDWKSTRPPVVLDAWAGMEANRKGPYSTILKWEAYKPVTYNGIAYGMKAASFGAFQTLPQKTNSQLELAVGGNHTPKDQLKEWGWKIRDPLEVSTSLEEYQAYIQFSKAELSIAKQGYVISRSGWLSERTGNYLASGRPALVQDTGFTDWLDCRGGLLSFTNQEEALAGMQEIDAHYDFHCRAAREVAEALFDSNKILTKLIEDAFRYSKKTD